MIEFYDDEDELVEDLLIPWIPAGDDSDEVQLDLWQERGNPAGQNLRNPALVFHTEDPALMDQWLKTGVSPQDERWPRVRFVDQDNSADPTQEAFVTDWRVCGGYRIFPYPSHHAGCMRRIEVRMRVPSTADGNSWRWRLSVLYSEYAIALPLGIVDRGILTGVGEPARSGLIRGAAVSASGSPDEYFHVAARLLLWRGWLHGQIGTSHELDQDDGASEALEADQSYLALASLSSGGVTITKGSRAEAPESPTAPAGEIPLSRVTVHYQAGGTSVIAAEDIEDLTRYDRNLVVPGDGLEVLVHPGVAQAGDTWRYWTDIEPVELPESDTSFLWQLASGLYEITEDEDAPEDGALLEAEIDTDSSDVTEIRDRRTYAGRTRILTLRGTPPGSPGHVQTVRVTDPRLALERVVYWQPDTPGTGGQMQVEVKRNGTSIYPSSATEDHRPVLAHDASDLVHDTGIPEDLDWREGDLISLETIENTTGGLPSEVVLELVCRVP